MLDSIALRMWTPVWMHLGDGLGFSSGGWTV
jgi:hypothetical protein